MDRLCHHQLRDARSQVPGNSACRMVAIAVNGADRIAPHIRTSAQPHIGFMCISFLVVFLRLFDLQIGCHYHSQRKSRLLEVEWRVFRLRRGSGQPQHREEHYVTHFCGSRINSPFELSQSATTLNPNRHFSPMGCWQDNKFARCYYRQQAFTIVTSAQKVNIMRKTLR